jgi:hypothetical protein
LGESDLDATVRDLICSPSMGLDGRIVCAYLAKRAENQGGDWLEGWLDTLWERYPERADLELAADTNGTRREARRSDLA